MKKKGTIGIVATLARTLCLCAQSATTSQGREKESDSVPAGRKEIVSDCLK